VDVEAKTIVEALLVLNASSTQYVA